MIAIRRGFDLSLIIPWHGLCSDNRKYMNRRFVLSPQYRQSKLLICQIAKAAAREQGWLLSSDMLEIHVRIIEPNHRRRDLNYSKNLKDGISASRVIWKDDSQVRRESWEFLPSPAKNLAGAVISIRPYSPQSTPPKEQNTCN